VALAPVDVYVAISVFAVDDAAQISLGDFS
jgi:hypothetical protein